MRGVATRAEQRFHLDPGGWAHARPRLQHHLQTVARAVWEDNVLRLRYQRGDGVAVRRTVNPLGLVHKTGSWYLVAVHRRALRVYRVDRVTDAVTRDEQAWRPDGFDLSRFWADWERAYADSLPTFSTVVRLGPRAQRYRDALGTLAPRVAAEEVTDTDGWVRQTLVFDSAEVAMAALFALAPDVEVVEPTTLREGLRAAAHQVAQRNTGATSVEGRP
jgi:predicted DNA-binding transcriptional regulator YafY